MEQLKKPVWLLLTFVLPISLLLFLFYECYQVIESLLTDEQHHFWNVFGIYFSSLVLIAITYVAYLFFRKKTIHYSLAWGILLINILNITLYFFFIDKVLPFNIPAWMFTSSDLEIYPYSFLIPGALYGLILLVLKYTPNPEERNPFVNLAAVIGLPLVVFVLSMFSSMINPYGSARSEIFKYIPIFFMVFLTCGFLFFLVRMIFIFTKKSKKERKTLGLIVKILFTGAFPVAGLYFNNEIGFNEGGMFGDFNHPIYYIFSVVNSILLCLPNSKNILLRWLVFIGKSILLIFILYFFTIFLPYLPLSIIAILLVGFGFLMLAPIIVFVYQISSIRDDIIYLKTVSSKYLVYILFTASVSVLPIFITVDYKLDRMELDASFDFLYNRGFDDEKKYSFNPNRVDRLFKHIKEVKSVGYKHTPFLDSYYNWIVLDNLMLSDKKINEISSVLQGKEIPNEHRMWSWFTFPTHNAILENYTTESKYNGEFWTSYVHLNVASNDNFETEYRMFLTTPNDCYISNYYLDIDGKREYGILAEKKSANWVYNNIVKTRRDPGIITTIGQNKHLLKVFPVPPNENRTTGIEFTHKEPIEILINDTVVQLGDNAKATSLPFSILEGNGIFIPSQAKTNLETTVRKPEYHLIIDHSINNKMSSEEIETIVTKVNTTFSSGQNLNMWSCNYNNSTLSSENWKKELQNIEKEGGFYPEFLMKKILIDNYKNHSSSCPIFIIIKPNNSSLSILTGFSNLMFTSPDNNQFYVSNNEGEFSAYDLESGKKGKVVKLADIKTKLSYVMKWKNSNWYLPFNKQSEILADTTQMNGSNTWQEGVVLDQDLNYYATHPYLETAWVDIIKSSMKSGILTPYTSYISLENEAQKMALLKKQKEVLESSEHFDLEEVQPMSEPSILWYIIAFILGLFFLKRFKL